MKYECLYCGYLYRNQLGMLWCEVKCLEKLNMELERKKTKEAGK